MINIERAVPLIYTHAKYCKTTIKTKLMELGVNINKHVVHKGLLKAFIQCQHNMCMYAIQNINHNTRNELLK